jgi:hypothetical protein
VDSSSIVRIGAAPSARHELLPEAGAQRTLEAVSSVPLFGHAPVPGGLEKRLPLPFLPRTPAYLITSSARSRRDGGIVIPRALAVWRLMTNSNFVGCSTGRSAGLVPFRSLSTYVAARR